MRSIAAYSATLAILGLTAVLLGWMLARVAEHPGAPREVGALPAWFTGAELKAAPKPGPAEGAPVTTAPAAPAAAEKAAADEGFVEASGGTVPIGLKEYELEPGKIKVAPGKITFVLRNEGRFAHNFNVEGPGIDTTAEKFSPGRTVRLEVALQEGEYKISCPLSNHDQRGMHGTLVVTSKLAGK
ncbi:MAG: cupredoxin domain-containing protein [Betaproteobacteria bacterium]|nr:cupredoxin domain-containing protein [Betaproteobacteria bacterium]